MRYAKSRAAACATAALLSLLACSHHTATPARSPLADSTRANALSAMHGEAMAHAKYLAYAAQAQQAGRGQAAQQFTSAAHTELFDHFAREADLIGLGGDIAANLRDAISDETNQATMYRNFAKQANADHDTAAAALFTILGDDEATQRKGLHHRADRRYRPRRRGDGSGRRAPGRRGDHRRPGTVIGDHVGQPAHGDAE